MKGLRVKKDLQIFLSYIRGKKEQKWRLYYSLLLSASPRLHLVSHRDINWIAQKHFVDSILILPYIKGNTIVDIGSGAGFPGVPISIMRPKWKVYLVEKNLRKAVFLKKLRWTLNLQNVEIISQDFQDWFASFFPTHPEGIELISRAGNYRNILSQLSEKKLSCRFLAYAPYKAHNTQAKEVEMKNPLMKKPFKLLIFEL